MILVIAFFLEPVKIWVWVFCKYQQGEKVPLFRLSNPLSYGDTLTYPNAGVRVVPGTFGQKASAFGRAFLRLILKYLICFSFWRVIACGLPRLVKDGARDGSLGIGMFSAFHFIQELLRENQEERRVQVGWLPAILAVPVPPHCVHSRRQVPRHPQCSVGLYRVGRHYHISCPIMPGGRSLHV